MREITSYGSDYWSLGELSGKISLYDLPSWIHSWHEVWYCVGVINNSVQLLCVRSGCSLPLAMAGDRMLGCEDLWSDTLLLSFCSGIYFSSIFSKRKIKICLASKLLLLIDTGLSPSDFWCVNLSNNRHRSFIADWVILFEKISELWKHLHIDYFTAVF